MVDAVKKLLLVLLVLFSVPFAQAAFSSVFTPVDNEILPNETASFDLAISNFDPTIKRFQVYSIDPNWVVDVEPRGVAVDSGTSGNFVVSLRPKTNVPFGSQGISVNVKDLDSGDLVKKTLFVAVKNSVGTTGRYQPSVNFVIGLPQVIDPREPTGFDVNLRNRNALDIKDMTMTISSPHYDYETTIDVESLGEHSEFLTMQLEDTTQPGTYVLSGTLKYRDLIVTKVERQYTIGEFATIEQTKDEQALFLKNTQTIRLTNDGNVAKNVTVTLPANIIQRVVSSQEPDANHENGQYVWQVSVAPGEETQVSLTKNYRYIIGLLIIGIIGLLLYYRLRSPIVALKEAVGIEAEGMSKLKYRLFIKNRSNKVIQGVEVYDKIAKIADLKETHVLGTLKPTKTTKTKSGTLLHWNIDILEPYEERILSYTAECKLQIVGRMRTPQSKVKFETGRGQERIIYSHNILVVEK